MCVCVWLIGRLFFLFTIQKFQVNLKRRRKELPTYLQNQSFEIGYIDLILSMKFFSKKKTILSDF